MNKFSYITFLFSLMLMHCVAQPIQFKRVYGGTSYDYGYSAVQTVDKGYIIAGVTSSFGYGNSDVYLEKIDSLGVHKWYNIFGGINIDRGLSIKQLPDSGFVIAGYTNSIGLSGYNMYLVRTNSTGDTLWTRTYGGTDWDFANAIELTNDGGFIMAGGTYSYGFGDEDMYVVKLNAIGDTLWTKTYGGIHQEEAFSIKQTVDGGYIVAGYTNSFGAGAADVYYIKINSVGDTTWTKTLGGPGDDRGNSIVQTTDGGYLLAGYKNDTTMHINQAYVVKTNAVGAPIWVREFGAPNDAAATAAIEDSYGNYVWAGKLNLGGQTDIYFYKLDINGGYVYATTHGTNNGNEEAYFLHQTLDNGYIVGGTTNGIGYGLNDVFFIKTDTAGLVSSANITIDVNGLNSIKESMHLYPNPSSDKVYVQVNSFNTSSIKITELQVYDLAGKEVLGIQPLMSNIRGNSALIELNAGELQSGIYMLQLNLSTGTLHQKLIVQH